MSTKYTISVFYRETSMTYAFRMKTPQEEIVQWIKGGLEHKDKNQSDLADALNLTQPRISEILSYNRQVKLEELPLIAEYLELDLPPPFRSEARRVNVVGYVGGGAEVWPFDDHAHGSGLDEIELPAPMKPEAVAVIVRGDSMRPAMRDGDAIFYDELVSGSDLFSLVGVECVVRLADGRTYVKELAKGTDPTLWTLISYNGTALHDCVVEWAAVVKFIKRKLPFG